MTLPDIEKMNVNELIAFLDTAFAAKRQAAAQAISRPAYPLPRHADGTVVGFDLTRAVAHYGAQAALAERLLGEGVESSLQSRRVA